MPQCLGNGTHLLRLASIIGRLGRAASALRLRRGAVASRTPRAAPSCTIASVNRTAGCRASRVRRDGHASGERGGRASRAPEHAGARPPGAGTPRGRHEPGRAGAASPVPEGGLRRCRTPPRGDPARLEPDLVARPADLRLPRGPRARRWLLPWAVVLSSTGVALAGLAPSYWALLALVLVSGLGVAAYHPEGYRTANQVAGDRKATGLSLFSIGGNIGIALGPPRSPSWCPASACRAPSGSSGPGLLVAALIATVLPTLIAPPAGARRPDGASGRPRHARGDGAPDRGGDRPVVDAARARDLRPLPVRRRPRPGPARDRTAPLRLPRRGRGGHAGGGPIADRWGPGATSRASCSRRRSSPASSGGRAAGWRRRAWRRPASSWSRRSRSRWRSARPTCRATSAWRRG